MSLKDKKLSPLLKWPGWKEQELKYINPSLPSNFENYYEPFVWGWAVYFSLNAKKYYINDKSTELIWLYKIINSPDRQKFFKVMNDIIHNWELLWNILITNQMFFLNLYKTFSSSKINELTLRDKIIEFILSHTKEFNWMFERNFNHNIKNFIDEIEKNLVRKIKRMKKIESEKWKLSDEDVLKNIETALKSAFYMHFRYLYNNKEKHNLKNHFIIAIFLFIRNFAYSWMFRYNNNWDFNVPYWWIWYNGKWFSKKVEYLQSEKLLNHLSKTKIENKDFEIFFENNKPQKNDFIFLDPPYDSNFSTYDKNSFNKQDQERLANYLVKKCKSQWMMIIKNTDFIYDLYSNKWLNIQTFDKKYLVSFMNRNNKDVKHLLITNY